MQIVDIYFETDIIMIVFVTVVTYKFLISIKTQSRFVDKIIARIRILTKIVLYFNPNKSKVVESNKEAEEENVNFLMNERSQNYIRAIRKR
jgi:hypothetical protein